MEYKGYKANPEYDGRIYFGKLEGIKDLVTIEAETLADFERELKSSVEEYLAFQKSLKPFQQCVGA